MKITDLFIRRPVLALVINLMIIIAGLQAMRSLNVRQYPRSENSTPLEGRAAFERLSGPGHEGP